MKKEMRLIIIISIIFGSLLIYLTPVFADFDLGKINNQSYELDLSYGPREAIRGWINISLDEEPANSLFTAFDSDISLIDFLDENSVTYTCFPNDCEPSYSATNAQDSKQFTLGYYKEKLIGIKITDNTNGITGFTFNVSLDTGSACHTPLEVDLLNDGIVEYSSDEMSDDFCQIQNPTGCFEESDSNDSKEITNDFIYCEEINIPVNKKLMPGAEIIGTGDAEFKFTIITSADEKSCTSTITEGGEITCDDAILFDEELEQPEQAIVCITESEDSTGTYEIKYERIDTCGYSENSEGGQVDYDFNIFIKPGKYEGISDFVFNQEEIYGDDDTDLVDYIYNELIIGRYGGSCDPECVIPIKISYYGSEDEQIIISDLRLDYSFENTPEHIEDIYDISESNVLIDSDFLKLDLEKGNFLVSDEIGDEDFVLELGGKTIIDDEEINIKAVPQIKDIIPHEAPALVNYPFVVLLEDPGTNLTYTWDFGDNSSKQTTDTKILKHAYSAIGTYDLTVIVSNKFGNSTKTVKITTRTPEIYVNETIVDYKNKLNKIESEINKLPEWIKKEIGKMFDVDDLKSQVSTQKTKYDGTLSGDGVKFVEIMSNLLALNIPNSFNISQKINPSNIIPYPDQINLAALDYLGAGGIDGSEKKYSDAVTNWFTQTLNMKMESKTYALYYEGSTEDLYSYVKVTLTPKPDQNLGEVYFLVNGNPDEIKINTAKNVRDYDDASGIVFSELTSAETIEFLYPKKVSVESFPIYISPEFRDLEFSVEPGVCNFNKKCEKNLGETYKNCRSDCKPIGLTILWIFILLFVALVVYIILQEWYKRNYESRLFKDKNQLFNLINFMNNSFNQGMRKSEIISKLKEIGWENEQLTYAWNKFQGKRTGMWEIPLFKWVEKRQVKKELAKRSSVASPPNYQRRISSSRLRRR